MSTKPPWTVTAHVKKADKYSASYLVSALLLCPAAWAVSEGACAAPVEARVPVSTVYFGCSIVVMVILSSPPPDQHMWYQCGYLSCPPMGHARLLAPPERIDPLTNVKKNIKSLFTSLYNMLRAKKPHFHFQYYQQLSMLATGADLIELCTV